LEGEVEGDDVGVGELFEDVEFADGVLDLVFGAQGLLVEALQGVVLLARGHTGVLGEVDGPEGALAEGLYEFEVGEFEAVGMEGFWEGAFSFTVFWHFVLFVH
jgi:hypothetical protein